ncbi:MAG: hypothetical protein WKI04_11765 [Ferruginibacter sp.]
MPVKLAGQGLPPTYSMFVTDANEDCKDHGSINSSDALFVPPGSVVTLYKKN